MELSAGGLEGLPSTCAVVLGVHPPATLGASHIEAACCLQDTGRYGAGLFLVSVEDAGALYCHAGLDNDTYSHSLSRTMLHASTSSFFISSIILMTLSARLLAMAASS